MEGRSALESLRRIDAPLFLSPSEELAQAARSASSYLFASLKRYTSKCPIQELITDGFDAEQIWPQIETQSEPLIKTLRTHLRKLEKNPQELEKQFNLFGKNVDGDKGKKDGEAVIEDEEMEEEAEEEEEEEEEEEYDDDDEEEEEEEEYDDDEEEEEEEEEEEGEEEEGDGLRDVEDKFLKIKELEKYLEEDEAREYGIEKEDKRKRKRKGKEEDEDEDEDEDESEDEEDEEEEEEDELGLMEMDDLEDDGTGTAKYDDFFGGKKKSKPKKTSKQLKKSADSDLEGSDDSDLEGSDDSDLDERPNNVDIVEKKNLSTHEKGQEKLRSQIEDMERANLEPKEWMMQGEITAAKRLKNSALEVDLDFEHNVRPPPVITEEVTASLEELIQKRILEGRFNDVQKPPTLLNKAPKERKEMDENKSKKGLAEIYESEYVQKTGLVATALSFSDEQKKEASTLFKILCLKLDALSHFHFTPKPPIEDMSIQANVPALAMEEIAPLAVSDAAMLAPEEVFAGKGDIKEQTELTQDERKRRRAKKKRKFKAESVKRVAGKAEQDTKTKDAEGNEAS